MKLLTAASMILFASLNSYAVGSPISTGAVTVKHAMSVFPKSTVHGSVVGGDKCVVETQYGQDGKSIMVSVVTSTKAGLNIAMCNLRSDNAAVREDSTGSEFPTTENLFGNSDYVDGEGTPVGCRFGRIKNAVIVIDFDGDQTGYCEL